MNRPKSIKERAAEILFDSTDLGETAAQLVTAADATRPLEGSGANDGKEAPWAEPLRMIAAALRSLDARLSAVEARAGGERAAPVDTADIGTQLRALEERVLNIETAPAPQRKDKRR